MTCKTFKLFKSPTSFLRRVAGEDEEGVGTIGTFGTTGTSKLCVRQTSIEFAAEGLLLANRVGRNCGIQTQEDGGLW
jgi:hypothetical protein